MSQTNPTFLSSTSYELLVKRIQEIISSPKSQLDHQALISKRPSESIHDWERLLEEISEADGVTLTRYDNHSAEVAWFVEKIDANNAL